MRYPVWRHAVSAVFILILVIAVVWTVRTRPIESVLASLVAASVVAAIGWWYQRRRARRR